MNSLRGDVHVEYGSSQIYQPMSRERFEEIREPLANAMTEALLPHLPELNELLAQRAEAKREMEKGQALIKSGQAGMAAALVKIESGQAKIESGQAKIESGQAGMAAALEKRAIGEKMLAESKALRQEGEQGCALAMQNIRKIVTTRFFRIFNPGVELPVEKVDALFTQYLSDDSIATVKEPEKAFIRINSTDPIIRYLKDHPGTKVCDLRSFKGEVYDLPSLAEYLKTSTVRLIAINRAVPKDGQESLVEAAAVRSGGLKIQYA